MLSIFKGKRFSYVILLLVVLSLAIAGCGSGSSGVDPNENNGSNEIDLAKYVGTWKSPARVIPSVEFTVGEFIETVKSSIGGITKTSHYFKGTVKCTILEGGQVSINSKPDFTVIPARMDHIVVEQIGDSTLFYVKAGYDATGGGTVDIAFGQILSDSSLTTYVNIQNEGTSVYVTPGFDDVFTKK